MVPLRDPLVDSLTIRAIAVEADVDPRSVLRELRASRGEDRHVRGRAGERVRAALMRRGLLVRSAA